MRLIPSGSIRSEAEVVDLRLPVGAWQMLSSERSVDSNYLEIAGANGERLGEIKFECSLQGEQLDPAKQNEFKSDFCREIVRLEKWAVDRNWPELLTPELQVAVSDRFKISKSLVPAWSGHSGRMEFSAWRVIARKAAIVHELVHVFFPNGNRLLAEGLAVYLQAEIGSNPAFPNFGKLLHKLVRELLPSMVPGFRAEDGASLEPLRFSELDAIATPSPLALRIGNDVYGEEPRGQAHIYPLAGSFVQHLIEAHGLEAFRALYDRTPLAPSQQHAGSPYRWSEVYGSPLSKLEAEWKSMIASG